MKQTVFSIFMTFFLVMLTGCGGDGKVQEETPVLMTLSAVPDTDSILLRWHAVEDVTAYRLEWGEVLETLDKSFG